MLPPNLVDDERVAGLVAALAPGRFPVLLAEFAARLAETVDLVASEALRSTPEFVASRIHRLRGSAASLGLTALTTALDSLESAVDARPYADVRAAAAELHTLHMRSLTAIGPAAQTNMRSNL